MNRLKSFPFGSRTEIGLEVKNFALSSADISESLVRFFTDFPLSLKYFYASFSD
jgi:hypothetical protein